MSKIKFTFNGSETIIQCNNTDKMEAICKKFIDKVGVEPNKIFFLYDGKKINFNSTFYELANTF